MINGVGNFSENTNLVFYVKFMILYIVDFFKNLLVFLGFKIKRRK